MSQIYSRCNVNVLFIAPPTSWIRCLGRGCPGSALKNIGIIEPTSVQRWPFHLEWSSGQNTEVSQSQPLHDASVSSVLPPTNTIRHGRRHWHMLAVSCNSHCCHHLHSSPFFQPETCLLKLPLLLPLYMVSLDLLCVELHGVCPFVSSITSLRTLSEFVSVLRIRKVITCHFSIDSGYLSCFILSLLRNPVNVVCKHLCTGLL